MPLIFGAAESHPMVDALLRTRVPRWSELNRAIDQRDDMYHFLAELFAQDRDRALVSYFTSTLEQFELLRYIARWRFADGPRTFLDFASGYGRLTRLLVHERFAREVHASDILEGAMTFQAAQFGVKTILSTTQPSALPIAGRYDLIFVASLFTHLPPESFTRWLQRLAGLLEPEGLLVFSVHDESVAPGKVDGISFRAQSESRVLDTNEYGSTWVTESFVRAEVAAAGLNFDCVRLPRALSDWQDVYVISPARLTPGEPRRVPRGFVEGIEIDGTGAKITGWAVAGDETAARVEVRVEDEVVATAATFFDRPDVAAALGGATPVRAGWHCLVPHAAVRSFRFQVVTVSAFSRANDERILFLGTLESLVSHVEAARAKNLQQQVTRHETASSELALLIAELYRVRAARDHELDLMRKSPFWKARSTWLTVKRALRLGR
ncbi:MAG TPA: class I SAM-dependent methyltransferase, partial [Thermoanaerobaculia bacterium]